MVETGSFPNHSGVKAQRRNFLGWMPINVGFSPLLQDLDGIHHFSR